MSKSELTQGKSHRTKSAQQEPGVQGVSDAELLHIHLNRHRRRPTRSRNRMIGAKVDSRLKYGKREVQVRDVNNLHLRKEAVSTASARFRKALDEYAKNSPEDRNECIYLMEILADVSEKRNAEVHLQTRLSQFLVRAAKYLIV